jgi:predicted dehydrogenase
MLAGAPFDLMVNLTDMQEHGRPNKKTLEAGKHVWSEKPLANTYLEGRALLDLAKRKGLRIWGAPVVVNSPQFAFMSKTIQEGKLGKVSAEHVLHVFEIIEAARKSGETGERIKLQAEFKWPVA